MTTPIRITLSRRKGWRMPSNTVKVCRPGKWGNPFAAIDPKNRDHVALAVGYFNLWINLHHSKGFPCGPSIGVTMLRFPHWSESTELRKQLHELRGKNLACWCKPDMPCHADVLLRLANAETTPLT